MRTNSFYFNLIASYRPTNSGKNTGLSMGISFLWESHGKRPMGWDRHKLLWDGKGTDKYVPWTTLENRKAKLCHLEWKLANIFHFRISIEVDRCQTF